MRYPRLVRPGTVRVHMVLNVDVAPTLLDLAGVTPPAKLHGRSFRPFLGEPAGGWRTRHSPNSSGEGQPEDPRLAGGPDGPHGNTFITRAWTGWTSSTTLSAPDPAQAVNRLADPAAQPALGGLQQELKSLLESMRRALLFAR